MGVLIGLAGGLASGAAQHREERPPILSVETNLVMLPITVVDRHDRLVTGLTQEHFTVYDNGQRQSIDFFTSEDLPSTVGLLIDSSSSMRGMRETVTATATGFAAVSHPLDELFTLNFNEAVWPGLPPPLVFAENAEQLQAALSAAPARGMTALYDAVYHGLEHLKLGTRERKALIVVSDGGDNASSRTFDAVLEHARRTGVAIYAVTLRDPDNHDARPGVLRRLASETGGKVFTARNSAAVADSFAQIAREIRSGYTIGFSPLDPSEAGFHAVRVVVNDGHRRALVVRTRAGYYAGQKGDAR
jgi:Ca-activated chloride channel family protein